MAFITTTSILEIATFPLFETIYIKPIQSLNLVDKAAYVATIFGRIIQLTLLALLSKAICSIFGIVFNNKQLISIVGSWLVTVYIAKFAVNIFNKFFMIKKPSFTLL